MSRTVDAYALADGDAVFVAMVVQLMATARQDVLVGLLDSRLVSSVVRAIHCLTLLCTTIVILNNNVCLVTNHTEFLRHKFNHL